MNTHDFIPIPWRHVCNEGPALTLDTRPTPYELWDCVVFCRFEWSEIMLYASIANCSN